MNYDRTGSCPSGIEPGSIVQLNDISTACHVISQKQGIKLVPLSLETEEKEEGTRLGILPAVSPESLGDPAFKREYGLDYAYYVGAMANGIHSGEMVIALAQKKMLGIFGAGGLSVERIEQTIKSLKAAIPNGTFGFNLLHNTAVPEWEMECVNLYLKYNVNVIEAAAYINLTLALVLYRVKGLRRSPTGGVICGNRIIAKVSRNEVAVNFFKPPPEKVVTKLCKDGWITAEQVELAKLVAMADDVTVEGDSGGHTDHGLLSCIFQSIVQQRDEFQKKHRYATPVRVGAAGGLGTPQAIAAAFAMGAAYVVTGSVNQACIEAGTSKEVKALLGKIKISDVVSAPSTDMFEIGARVQVVKSGTMYAVRAQKLYGLYKEYDSLDDIPEREIKFIEQTIFKKSVDDVWAETIDYFVSRNMSEYIKSAGKQPKKKMALTFRWYLGQTSFWAVEGKTERIVDYQIWCGPAMGAMNEWLKGSAFEAIENRKTAEIALLLMTGAAYISRLFILKVLGVALPNELQHYPPILSPATAGLKRQYSAIVPSSGQTKKSPTGPIQQYDLSKSTAYTQLCQQYLPGGRNSNLGNPEPSLVIPFVNGKNSRLWDKDQNEYLDLSCKSGALIVGHQNEIYNEALIRQMQTKATAIELGDLELEVSEKLIKHIPSADQIRFGLSGTETIQNSLRLARAYTRKNKFIRFFGHYHGSADNIVGGMLSKKRDNPVPTVYKADWLGTFGRASNILADQSYLLPWNDLKEFENLVESKNKEIAAVIMEPICVSGGGEFPQEGYIEKIRALCDKHSILLIFDEVQTGIRVGLGGVEKLLGIKPDLTIIGHVLGGGSVPISALAGRADIMSLYTRNRVIQGGAFNGYPLSLAAAKSTLSILEDNPMVYADMAKNTRQISSHFVKAAADVDLPLVIQGMPTVLSFHLQQKTLIRAEDYSDKVRNCGIVVHEIAKRYGIYFDPAGRIYSNITLSSDDVSFFESRIFAIMTRAKAIIDEVINKPKIPKSK